MEARIRRRELLGAAGIGAAALALPSWARAQVPIDPTTYPEGGLRPELVTVGARSAAAWWPSEEPGDTTLRIGRAGGPLRELTLERGVRIHAAAVNGLEPGAEYRYELVTDGRVMAESTDNPGRFRTLVPPTGRVLARIAVINDLHVGEKCSGTGTTVGGQSVPPCYSVPEYAARMTAASVRAIRASRPDLVIANGDLTDRGRPDEVRHVLRILKRLRLPVLLTRGNHDRTFPETEECAEDGDCLRHFAFPRRKPGDHALTSMRRIGRRVMVIGLDSCDPVTGHGRLDLGGQIEWLDSRLEIARRERRRAVVAFHHPVTRAANNTTIPPLTYGVDREKGGAECLEVLARHPHVALVVAGHTHRNYVSYDEGNPHPLPFLENGAVKEYPGGFGLITLRERGYVRTFHRMTEEFCREWNETSARQYFGRHPDYTLGPLSARAFVVGRDGEGRPPATALGPYEDPVAGS
jgi:Icc protein